MEFLAHYVKPGLTILMYVCILYVVLRCVFLVIHFVKLDALRKRRGAGLSSTEIVDVETMVRKDKRHIITTIAGIIGIIVCFYGIDLLRKWSAM